MKTLLVSTSDLNGGAARAAYRLHIALRESGIESFMLVFDKRSDDEHVISARHRVVRAEKFVYNRIDDYVTRPYKTDPYVRFSLGYTSSQLLREIERIDPDIINLHWISKGFISIERLSHLRRPLVWTLHDMWAFTGGCHYDGGCGKFTQTCGACPILNSTRTKDLSYWIYQRKKNAYPLIQDLTIVTPSRWLAECVRASSLLGERAVHVIPNALDTDCYRPAAATGLRQRLAMPDGKPLVLFGSMGAEIDQRKGYRLLMQAVEKLVSRGVDFEIAIFGSIDERENLFHGIPVHSLGKLSDEQALVEVYSAAAVTVVPSRQENLGNVIMESLACGTPVVGFDIGGNPDMIVHRENGYLATPWQAEDLADGIVWALQHNAHHELQNTCQQLIREFSSYPLAAQRYGNLFGRILAGSNPGSNEETLA